MPDAGRSQSRSTSEMTPEEYEQWLRDTPLSFRGSPSLTVRREAVEQIVRAGAEWGYRMALLGVTPCPVPVVEWDEQGRPRVTAPDMTRKDGQP